MSKSIKSIIEEKLKNKKWKTSMISTIAVRKGYKLSPRTVSRIINEGHKPKDSTLRIIAKHSQNRTTCCIKVIMFVQFHLIILHLGEFGKEVRI